MVSQQNVKELGVLNQDEWDSFVGGLLRRRLWNLVFGVLQDE